MANIFNIVSIDRLIALIASVAGFVSALATLLTVSEMRRQREGSYKPTFLFKTTYLAHLIKNKANKFIVTTEEVGKDVFENHPQKMQFDEFIPIHFHNIGLGSAKSVSFKWNYDLSGFESNFEKFSAYTVTKNDKEGFGIETIDGSNNQWVVRKHKDYSNLEFVLPVYNKQETFSIPIPALYHDLLETLLSGIPKSNNEINISLDLPKMFFEVAYLDIENNKFKENYSVSFKIRSRLMTTQNLKPEYFYLYVFEVDQIK
jgi:hypothetical protein